MARAPVRRTDSRLRLRHRLDHVLARWGYRRSRHRVEPGLWGLGDPGPDDPVLVTANYTLSFDALRAALRGRRAWILVLDTRGVNVWCAAAEGAFSTEELVRRVRETELAERVSHRRLILPQLAGPGVAGHRVREETGFRVLWGPVRAAHLPAFLDGGSKTDPSMRRVRFPLGDRLALVPVELVHALLPALLLAAGAGWAGGFLWAGAVIAAFLAGLLLFPLLLPLLPFRDFWPNGGLLGVLALAPFAWRLSRGGVPGLLAALGMLLLLAPVSAWLALGFTGCTPYTSASHVRREFRRWTRPMAASLVLGGALLGWRLFL